MRETVTTSSTDVNQAVTEGYKLGRFALSNGPNGNGVTSMNMPLKT